MKYISTRGGGKPVTFLEAMLAGLAPDGGLYTPEVLPVFTAAQLKNFKDFSYARLALEIFSPFAQDVPPSELERVFKTAYADFGAPEVAPLVHLWDNKYLLELFHGPTLAFKDFAMRPLGLLFDYALERAGKKAVIAAATSGDTGSAAIEAFKNCKNVKLFVLHPRGKVSDVQRRQMTTVISSNVKNIALEGSFDDCQNIVKTLFADDKFRGGVNLSAVNSINWARIAAQTVYYFYARAKFGEDVTFCVPTGNFGNILAGYYAKNMGAGIKNLIIASNANDILTRFMQSGKMEKKTVTPTLSPSMDIQVSSNFERLLFEYSGRNGAEVSALMEKFKTGSYDVGAEVLKNIKFIFEARACSDKETLAEIADAYKKTGRLIDPHTAVGLHAAASHKGKEPVVILSTADAAKFPDAAEKATGKRPPLPARMADLMNKKEEFTVLENSAEDVKKFIYAAV